MTPKGWAEERFIPGTRPISIGSGVVYRPLRSWHSGTYAGERLTKCPWSDDRSGCIREGATGIYVAPRPLTVTHRLYWSPDAPERTVSAFLSYPGGMGVSGDYFWEANIGEFERYASEEEVEEVIRKHLTSADSSCDPGGSDG